jgi:hypothetical protein
VAIGAEQVRERRRRLYSRPAKVDCLQRCRLLDVIAAEAQLLADPGGGRLQAVAVERLVLEPPAPVLSPAGRGPYQ